MVGGLPRLRCAADHVASSYLAVAGLPHPHGAMAYLLRPKRAAGGADRRLAAFWGHGMPPYVDVFV